MPVPLDEKQDQRYDVAKGVGALSAEIAIATAGQKAAAAAAATTAVAVPGIGPAVAPIVYIVGAFSAGYSASMTAQEILDPDAPKDIARGTSAGLINLIPLAQTRNLGKVGVLLNNVNKRMYTDGSKTVAGSIYNLAKQGAIFGATDQTIRSIVGEKRLPTVAEFTGGAGLGAGAGGGLAIAGKGARFAYQNMGKLFKEFPNLKKFAGKTPVEVAEKTAEEIEEALLNKLEKNPKELNEILLKQFKLFEPDPSGERFSGEKLTNEFLINQLRTKLDGLNEYVFNDVIDELIPSVWGPTADAGVAKFFIDKYASIMGKVAPSFVINNKSITQSLFSIKEQRNLWESKVSEYKVPLNFLKKESEKPGNDGLIDLVDTISSLFRARDGEAFNAINDKINDLTFNYGKYAPAINKAVKAVGEARGYKKKLQNDLLPFIRNDKFRADALYPEGSIERLAQADFLNTFEKSIKKGNYYKRTFRIFVDSKYDAEAKENLWKADKVVEEVLGSKKLREIYVLQGVKTKSAIEGQVRRELRGYIDNSARKGGRSLVIGPLMARKDLPNSLKEFLGGDLATIPGAGPEVIETTLSSLGALTQRLKVENSIAKTLISTGLAKIKPDPEFSVAYDVFSDGEKKQVMLNLFQQSEKLRKKYGDDVEKMDFWKEINKFDDKEGGTDFEKLFIKKGNMQSEPIYITKELKRVLDTGFEEFENRAMNGALSPLQIAKDSTIDFYKAAVALTKGTKVLTAMQTYPTAFMGAVLQGTLNGVQVLRAPRQFVEVAGFGLSQLGGPFKKLSSKKYEEKIDVYREYGLLPGNVISSDIMQTLNSGRGRITKALSENPIIKTLGKAYSVFDTAMRIQVYENNESLLKKILTEQGLDPVGYINMVQKAAAIMTHETYNNYNRIASVIKQASHIGVLDPFVAFQTELTRTTYNSGKHIYQVLGIPSDKVGLPKVGGNYKKFLSGLGIPASVINNMSPQQVSLLKKEFMGRAVSFAAMVGVGGYVVPKMFNRFYGTSEEEMESLRTADIPYWDRDKTLVANYDPETKKGYYMNYSYSMPYEMFGRIFEMPFKGMSFSDAVDLAKSEYMGQGNFIFRAAAESIMGHDERGRPISLSPEKKGQLFDRLSHFLDQSFTPGIAREATAWVDKDRDLSNLLQKMVGLRWRNIDLKEDASYKIHGANRSAEDLSKEYTRVWRNENISDQEKNNQYQKLDSDRKIYFENMKEVYDSMLNLGYERGELIKLFNSEYKVSGKNVLNIANNIYDSIPLTPVSETGTGVIYEKLQGDNPREKVETLKVIEKTYPDSFNPLIIRRLMSYARQQEKINRSGASEEDKLLMSMDSMDRVEWLMQNRGLTADNKALIDELIRKRVLTRTDLIYIRFLSQSKTAPISGGY